MAAEIKNLRRVAVRIKRAAKNRERIVLFGDADLDGVASTIILEETLEALGARRPEIYFPDREKEGYGPGLKAMNYLKKFSPALLITLDCGISSFGSLELAKKMGFETIIIDHHDILNKFPDASLIIDPKQEADSRFKCLATAGIVFKLSQAILGKGLKDKLENGFLELAALATIADMMPNDNDNKIFIQKGLESLEKTSRPGLKNFWEIGYFKKEKNIRERAQRIIGALNSMEMKNHSNETYLLLKSKSKSVAEPLARDLVKRKRQKGLKIKRLTGKIEKKLLKEKDIKVILEGDVSLSLLLNGSVATNICNKFHKPTFIFKKGRKESKGSVRMPKELNGVKAMKACARFLSNYGGHPLAAGFVVKNENLEKLRKCLINYFKDKYEPR